ncbi:MAG TPA: TlpA disulfide reductase family protein [Anaerolineaceae bacterium]|nr:TlpA disulfide reductase family protein [Anaerolineaceae bacterium]
MKSRQLGMFAIGLGLGFILAAIFLFLRTRAAASLQSSTATGPVPGRYAPEFSLNDLQGNPDGYSKQDGIPVIINFWATWCPPCEAEMPLLQSVTDRYGDSVKVIAVNFDEPEEDVNKFAERLQLTMPVLLDPGAQVNQLYRNMAYPATFFIDSAGIIQARHVGELSESLMDGYLAKIGVQN